MTIHFFGLFLGVMLPLSAAFAQFSGGDGSETDPFQIRTVEDLDNVRHHLRSHFVLMNDLDFSGTSYANPCDTCKGWRPIGEYDTIPQKAFSGVFIGNNHKIRNLITKGHLNFKGLFGYIDSATIENVSIVDCHIQGDRHLGGLVGLLNSGSITGCNVTGEIYGQNNVGGLVGLNKGIIRKCSTTVITEATDIYGDEYCGCLAGVNQGVIEDCASGGKLKSGNTVGGLVGQNDGTINRCSSSASVDGGGYAGGLVGRNHGAIRECTSSCQVIGYNIIGGLIGYNVNGRVFECYCTGQVQGKKSVGGLTGQNAAEVRECYAIGSITGDTCVGGLIGTNLEEGMVISSYATGEVFTAAHSAGGLIGENRGLVHGCFSVGYVRGDSLVGGLIGKNSKTGKMKNCFSDKNVISGPRGVSISGFPNDQMKQVILYTRTETGGLDSAWDFTGDPFDDRSSDNIWSMRDGSSFPGLTSCDNRIIAENACYSIVHDSVLSLTLKAGDADGETVESFEIVSPPSNGTINVSGSSVVYTPRNGYCGDDEFRFRARGSDAKTGNGARIHLIISATFTGGDGSEGNPFLIKTVDELNGVRYHPDKHYKLVNNLDMRGSWYDSIRSMEHKGWIPIGDHFLPFTGSIDADGHTISNLFIEHSHGDIGLFGLIQNGTVDSLNLIGVNIKGEKSSESDRSRMGSIAVGALAGRIENGNIRSCFVEGRVVGGCQVGGLVGCCMHSTVIRCHTDGAVSASSYVGGLAGLNRQGTISLSWSTTQVQGGSEAGGLVGVNSLKSTIFGCWAEDSVTGSSQVGGLVGLHQGGSIIRRCNASGFIQGDRFHTGGLVGSIDTAHVFESSATGNVTGEHRVGGFSGGVYFGSITKCFSTGNVDGRGGELGGLTGEIGNGLVRIDDSYARGNIQHTWSWSEFGGLIGTLMGEVILNNCYATGIVIAEHPVHWIGGLCGGITYKYKDSTWNSFWDKTASGVDSSKGGTGKTTEQMKHKETYTDVSTIGLDAPWDFSSTWDISENINDGYPFLRWSREPMPVAISKHTIKKPLTSYAEILRRSPEAGVLVNFRLSQQDRVTFNIYDMQGRKVKTLIDCTFHTGTYHLLLSTNDLASSAYICKLQIGNITQIKPLAIAR